MTIPVLDPESLKVVLIPTDNKLVGDTFPTPTFPDVVSDVAPCNCISVDATFPKTKTCERVNCETTACVPIVVIRPLESV